MLAAVSLTAATVTPMLGGAKTGALSPSKAERVFDPARHGFGFYNWRVYEGDYPETDATMEDSWQASFERAFDRPIADLPDGLIEVLSRHVREGLLEAVRTNGYCYGMVFAAQKYFEHPEKIPAEFETASEITHPNAPRESGNTPILDEIREYHAAQYLDVYAWLGRYGLFNTALIDYEAQLADLCHAVDAFGTAGITVFTEDSVRSHQVLVYDYEQHADKTVLVVYDPNYTAEIYEQFTYTIEIDTSGETPRPKPIEYGVTYDQFIYNEYDREIRNKRESAGPFREGHSLFDRLFDTTVFVTTDSSLETAVIGPSGRRLERMTGDDAIHYRYGASNGTYTISLTGQRAEEYTVDLYASSRHRTVLDETIEGSITPGETKRYELTIGHGRATLETGLSSAAVLGAVGGGYAYHRR
jgi:hypothetical protein